MSQQLSTLWSAAMTSCKKTEPESKSDEGLMDLYRQKSLSSVDWSRRTLNVGPASGISSSWSLTVLIKIRHWLKIRFQSQFKINKICSSLCISLCNYLPFFHGFFYICGKSNLQRHAARTTSTNRVTAIPITNLERRSSAVMNRENFQTVIPFKAVSKSWWWKLIPNTLGYTSSERLVQLSWGSLGGSNWNTCPFLNTLYQTMFCYLLVYLPIVYLPIHL